MTQPMAQPQQPMHPSQQLAQQMQEAPHQAPVAPRQVRKRVDIPALVVEMDDWLTALKRAVAGYTALSLSLASAQGHIPEGDRRKGLPILEFKSSVDGQTPIVCCADLRKVNPEYLQHVMVPLINAQAADILEAFDEMSTRIEMARPMLYKMLGFDANGQPLPPQQADAA